MHIFLRKGLQYNPLIMTFKGTDNWVILSGHHTKEVGLHFSYSNKYVVDIFRLLKGKVLVHSGTFNYENQTCYTITLY